jgi:DNA-binding transcriptional MerR regulator
MRIGELADAGGVNPKTIRFYEQMGLLPVPSRTPSGYRDYGEDDAGRLVFVKTAQRLGLTLAEIREILAFRDRGERPCGYVLGVLDRQVTELHRRIAELQRLRDDLIIIKARADSFPEEGACYCGVIEHATIGAAPTREPQARSFP